MAAVVRQWMVRVGDANLSVRADAALAAQHHRRNTREVAFRPAAPPDCTRLALSSTRLRGSRRVQWDWTNFSTSAEAAEAGSDGATTSIGMASARALVPTRVMPALQAQLHYVAELLLSAGE